MAKQQSGSDQSLEVPKTGQRARWQNRQRRKDQGKLPKHLRKRLSAAAKR